MREEHLQIVLRRALECSVVQRPCSLGAIPRNLRETCESRAACFDPCRREKLRMDTRSSSGREAIPSESVEMTGLKHFSYERCIQQDLQRCHHGIDPESISCEASERLYVHDLRANIARRQPPQVAGPEMFSEIPSEFDDKKRRTHSDQLPRFPNEKSLRHLLAVVWSGSVPSCRACLATCATPTSFQPHIAAICSSSHPTTQLQKSASTSYWGCKIRAILR